LPLEIVDGLLLDFIRGGDGRCGNEAQRERADLDGGAEMANEADG